MTTLSEELAAISQPSYEDPKLDEKLTDVTYTHIDRDGELNVQLTSFRWRGHEIIVGDTVEVRYVSEREITCRFDWNEPKGTIHLYYEPVNREWWFEGFLLEYNGIPLGDGRNLVFGWGPTSKDEVPDIDLASFLLNGSNSGSEGTLIFFLKKDKKDE